MVETIKPYTAGNVASAVMTIAEQIANDRDVKPTDQDGMQKSYLEAESLVAKELQRQGLTAEKAMNMVEAAVNATASNNNLASELIRSALANEHAPVPSNDVDAEIDMESAYVDSDDADHPESDDEADAEDKEDESEGETNGATQTTSSGVARSDTTGNRSAKAKAADATSTRAKRAPRAYIEPEVERRHYTTTELSVSEIFRNLPPEINAFNFKLPVFNWQEMHPGVPTVDPHYNIDLEALLTALYGIARTKTTNIVGPHGSGKTKFVEQLAARLKMPLTVIPMDGQLTRNHLIGQEKIRVVDGATESYYSMGILPRALAEPGIILFDEVDRAVSDLQYACHSVYLNDGLTILEKDGRRIPMHPHNRVFATANTKGRGSVDGMYMASEEMSEATRDRFSLWIDMPYQSVEDDEMVLKKKVPTLPAGAATNIAKLAKLIRESFLGNNLSQTCSLRQQLEVADFAAFLIARVKEPEEKDAALAFAIRTVILGRASEPDQRQIEDMIRTLMPNIDNKAQLV